MKFMIVHNADESPEFRVHRHNCSDLPTEMRKRGFQNAWPSVSDDAELAIAREVKGFEDNDQGYTRADFYVCPCAFGRQ